jgi:hypothetical protein
VGFWWSIWILKISSETIKWARMARRNFKWKSGTHTKQLRAVWFWKLINFWIIPKCFILNGSL